MQIALPSYRLLWHAKFPCVTNRTRSSLAKRVWVCVYEEKRVWCYFPYAMECGWVCELWENALHWSVFEGTDRIPKQNHDTLNRCRYAAKLEKRNCELSNGITATTWNNGNNTNTDNHKKLIGNIDRTSVMNVSNHIGSMLQPALKIHNRCKCPPRKNDKFLSAFFVILFAWHVFIASQRHWLWKHAHTRTHTHARGHCADIVMNHTWWLMMISDICSYYDSQFRTFARVFYIHINDVRLLVRCADCVRI